MRRTLGALIGLAAAAFVLGLAYEYGFVRVNYPSRTEFPVRGIDVSRYQGLVDWPTVAAGGVQFAFVKATEGTDLRDPRFADNWTGAARANVRRGAYHFFTFCTPGAAQAANFIDVVPVDPTALPPAVDVEFAGNCRNWTRIEAIRAELATFLAAIEQAYGRRPIVYFTRESYERVLDGQMAAHPTWARSLFGRPGARFGPWTFWQYAHNGRLAGIEGLVDLNVFRGSADELREFVEGGAARPEHPTRLDLLTLLPFTGHAAPTEAIDLGGPDRRLLVRGWGEAVTLADGRRGSPVAEPTASVAYDAGAAPADLTLVVTAGAAPVAGAPARPQRRLPQGVSLAVEVNGARCRRARTREPDDLQFVVPAALQRPGRNVLTLRRPGGGPRDVVPPVVSRLEFRRQQKASQAEGIGNRLVLPAGAGITFYLRAPEQARLEFTVEPDGAPVRATLLADGTEPRSVATMAPGVRSDTALPAPAGQPIGIRFESDGRATVVAPAVVGRARAEQNAAPPPGEAPKRPNVILYVLDTLRADRLGCYGYGRPTSPHLDRFAHEGILFRNAVSQAPWTRPSVASILTGQLPAAHGAVTLRDRLRGDIPTLAERFRAGGYETAAFVTNINVAAPFGFDRGFDRYEYLPEEPGTPGVHVPAPRLHAAALAWLDGRADDEPFLLYLHATDTHAPYRPDPTILRRFVDPPPQPADVDALDDRLERAPERLSAEQVQTLSALYDAEIAQWDEAFGQLWDALRARGVDADTVVLFTADHGEEFRDHGGLEHGHTLYQEQVHVPLAIRLPGGRAGGQVVEALVRAMDLFPTLVELAGLPPGAFLPGRSIVSASGPIALDGSQEAVASTQFTRREVEAVVIPPWKVVFPPPGSERQIEVYDLANDPGETRDVAATHAVSIGYARQQLAAQKALVPPVTQGRPEAPVAPDVLERLRQLGYAVD